MSCSVEHTQLELPPAQTAQRASTKRSRGLDRGADVASLSSVACKRCRSRKVKVGDPISGSTSPPLPLYCPLANILACPCSVVVNFRRVSGASRLMFRVSSPMPLPREIIPERMSRIVLLKGNAVRGLIPTFSREVRELQLKLRRLQSAISRPTASGESPRGSEDGRLREEPCAASNLESPRFVGPGSGVGFFLSRLTAYQQGQANGTVAPQPQASSIVYHPPHPLPPSCFTFGGRRVVCAEYSAMFSLLQPSRLVC